MTSLASTWSWIDEVRCELLDNLRNHEIDILRTMTSLETATTARDEFARSIRTLEGIDQERSDRLMLSPLSRGELVRQYVSTSDAVVLTGTFRAASTVLKSVGRRTTFVFNGSGVNPAVVPKDADIEPTARDIVGSVTYNSGQELATLRHGSLTDPDVQVGPVLRRSSVDSSTEFLWSRSAQIVHGGSIDLAARIVRPPGKRPLRGPVLLSAALAAG